MYLAATVTATDLVDYVAAITELVFSFPFLIGELEGSVTNAIHLGIALVNWKVALL